MAINPISVPFRDPRRPKDFSDFPKYTVGLTAGRSKATLLIFRSRSINQHDSALVAVVDRFVTALKSNQVGDFSLGLPTLDVAEPANLDLFWIDPNLFWVDTPGFRDYITDRTAEYRDVLSHASRSGMPIAVPRLSVSSVVGRDTAEEVPGTFGTWVSLPTTRVISSTSSARDNVYCGIDNQPMFDPMVTEPPSGDIVPTIFHLVLVKVEGTLRTAIQLRPHSDQIGATIASFAYFPAGACDDHYTFTFETQLVASSAVSGPALSQSTPTGALEPWPISLSPMSWEELDQSSLGLSYVAPLDVNPTALRPTSESLLAYKELIAKLPAAHAYSIATSFCSRPDLALLKVPSTYHRDLHQFPLLVCPFGPHVFTDFAWRPSAAYVPLAFTPPEMGQPTYGSEFVTSGVLISLWPGALFVARIASSDYTRIPPLASGDDQPLLADFGALKPIL